MYAAFNLALTGEMLLNDLDAENIHAEGIKLHDEHKSKISNTLKSFHDSKGELVASKMQANWFPSLDAHAFISHSHKDSNIAISLSGWLKKELGLNSFIDSCAWGYADDLLAMIDREYCLNPNSTSSYNYEKRNRSTSHVHMMLSTALSMMMDKTECLIFLNTPSSITPASLTNESGTTDSPWIYSEIAMTRLVRRRKPEEHRQIQKVSLAKMLQKHALDESLKIKYGINLDHLTALSEKDLRAWNNLCKVGKIRGENSLDKLYSIKEIA